jgi:hypothetical protein
MDVPAQQDEVTAFAEYFAMQVLTALEAPPEFHRKVQVAGLMHRAQRDRNQVDSDQDVCGKKRDALPSWLGKQFRRRGRFSHKQARLLN